MQMLKYILLLIPFNVLAHPGHNELFVKASTKDWFYVLVWLLLAVVAVAGIRQLQRRHSRVSSRKADD